MIAIQGPARFRVPGPFVALSRLRADRASEERSEVQA